MKNHVGIDLGTTNSAICTYDGQDIRIWKSPEQNDVTPSAIYIDKRGNRYFGKRAYDSAPHNPDSSAMLFKRLMGTGTPVELPAASLTMRPEECSAEVLKVLFGYLPEEMRNDSETATVITVPAAFNQMQKDATLQSAELAGIGKVALMQEPVAAVMSVMRAQSTDGVFLIYDLGGGTLDVAIAESLAGRVNLLSHGGIAMCGGRDFDRLIVDNVVKPWLHENFRLPENLSSTPQYKSLLRLAAWSAERAKIELSSRDEAAISLSEAEARVRDEGGEEIYLDIPLGRETLDRLIQARLAETVEAARETLAKAGMNPHDVERIVFVGGPTSYKPLRDKVSFELGVPASTEINPMTAVAQGAALFAESIDWSTHSRSRKSNRGKLASSRSLSLAFNYTSRTPDVRAKIVVRLTGTVQTGSEFQVDSLDTGWTSGRVPLVDGATVNLALSKNGDNRFKVFVFDSNGGPVALEEDTIVITRTAATVDAIPASYSIGVEALEKLGGRPTLVWLVRAGEQLPKKGRIPFKAGEALKAGSGGSINFKLWEGEIEDPITDNRFIGTLKIAGNDFDDGVIAAGADLHCDYEILDSGNIVLEVSVPGIGGTFHSGHNFYSRQEGQIDFSTDSIRVLEDSQHTLSRIEEIEGVVDDPKLDQAREKVETASQLDPDQADPEQAQEAMEQVLQAKRMLFQVRKDHLKEIRQLELDGIVRFFDENIRQYARPSEETGFDNLAKTAQRAIDRNDREFENHLDALRGKNFDILWRQDWFVVDKFKALASSPHRFNDRRRFEELVATGVQAMKSDDIDRLRQVIGQLWQIQADLGSGDDMLDVANIIRG